MCTIKTNSLVNSFIYMATSSDPKLGGQHQAITQETGTRPEPKIISWRSPRFYVKGGDLQLMLSLSLYVSSSCGMA